MGNHFVAPRTIHLNQIRLVKIKTQKRNPSANTNELEAVTGCLFPFVVAVKSGAQVIGFTNVQNPIASIITETQKRIYSRKRLEFGVFGVNIEFVLSAVLPVNVKVVILLIFSSLGR